MATAHLVTPDTLWIADLRAALARHDLSCGKFAKLAGINASHFNSVLHEKRYLGAETRRRILAALPHAGIPIEEVRRG